MKNVSCPNKNLPQWKELVEVVGENQAYYLWDQNNGNPLDKAPNGQPSKLFSDLLSNFNEDRNTALQEKSKVYSENFKTWFEGHSTLDENGEPMIESLNQWQASIPLFGNSQYQKVSQVNKRRKQFTANDWARSNRLSQLLQQLFPEISLKFVESLENGAVGQMDLDALEALIHFSESGMDTIPHEYAHYYVALFRDSNLVKEGIRVFGSEEALVQAIGERTVQMDGKVRNWWQKFLDFVKKALNKHKYYKQSLLNELTDSFVSRRDIGEQAKVSGVRYQQPTQDNTEQQAPKSIQEVRSILKDMENNTVFDGTSHTYTDAATGKPLTSVTALKARYNYDNYDPSTEDDVQQRISEQSRRTGTLIHAILESLWTGNFDKSNFPEVSDATIKNLKAIVNKLKDTYEFVATEALLADPDHQVAGTCDLLLRNKETGKYALFDYKTKMVKYNDKDTNKKGKKLWGFQYVTSTTFNLKTARDGYDFQLSTYEKILKDKGIEIESRGIIPIVYSMNEDAVGHVTVQNAYLSKFFGKDTEANESLGKDGFALIVKKKQTEYDVDFLIFGDNEIIGGDIEFNKQMLNDLKSAVKTISKKLEIQKELARLKNRRTRARDAARLYETMQNLNELDALFQYLRYSIKQIEGMSKTISRLQAKGPEANWSLDYLREYNELAASYNQVERIQAIAERYVTIFGEDKVKDVRRLCSALTTMQRKIKGAYDLIGRQIYFDAIQPYIGNVEYEMKERERKQYIKDNPRLPNENKQQFDQRVQQHVDQWAAENRDLIAEETRSWIIAQSQIADAGFETSSFVANVQSVYESRDPFVQAMVIIFDQKMQNNLRELLSYRSRMNKILKEFRAVHGLRNFSNLKEVFDDIISYDEAGNPYLVSDIDPKFQVAYKTMWDAVKADVNLTWQEKYQKRQEWLDQNCPIDDLEAYTAEYNARVKRYIEDDATLDDVTKKAINDNIDENGNLKESWYDLYKEGKITYLIREKLGDIEDELDAEHRHPLKSIYHNSKYDKLMQLKEKGDPKYKLWELLTEISQIDKTLPYSLRLNGRLPAIVKRGAEAVGSDGVVQATKNGIQRETIVMADDDIRGSFIDDDGKRLNQIPMFYFHNDKVTPQEQSYDLPTIFYKWYEAALNYKAKQQMESYVIMTQNILHTRRTQTGQKSLLNKTQQQEVSDVLPNTAKQFDFWVEQVFYGNRAKDYGSFSIPFTNKKVDNWKLIDAIVSLFSKSTMYSNVVSAINNILVAEAQQSEEAFAAEYVDVKSYHDAVKIISRNSKTIVADMNRAVPKSFINQLAEWFYITDVNPNITLTGMARRSVSDLGYFLSTAGDRVIRLRMMVAFLLHERALDSEGNDIGSLLQYLSFDENNQLVVDPKVANFGLQEQDRLSLKMRRILMSLHGNYDGKRAAVEAETTWYGRAGLALRRWVEPSMERRFNYEHFSNLTGTVRKGFARSSLGYLFINNKFAAPIAQFVARHIFRIKGYQVEVLKWDNLSDLQRRNIIRAITGMSIALLAIGLFALFTLAYEDDNDEPVIISNLRYQLYRLYTDLTFYYFPTSFSKILQSPFPAISYVNDVLSVFAQIPVFWQEYESGNHLFDNKLLDKIANIIPGVTQIGRLQNIETEMEFFIRR